MTIGQTRRGTVFTCSENLHRKLHAAFSLSENFGIKFGECIISWIRKRHGTQHRADVLDVGIYLVETTTSRKPVQTTTKKSSKFTKKITHVDGMIIHNLVKYLVQTRLRL